MSAPTTFIPVEAPPASAGDHRPVPATGALAHYGLTMIIALIIVAVVTVVSSFPATWLLMLFLGNVGLTQVGFWGALPLGILVSLLIGAASSTSGRRYSD